MTQTMTNLPSQPPIYPNSGALPANAANGTVAVVLGSPLTLYGYDGTNWSAITSGGATAVTSVTGTANRVTASPTTGAVVLSTPQDIALTSNVQFASIKLTTGATNGYILTSDALGNGAWAANTGNVSSLTATANQTTVSASTGAITIGTVQDIGTVSSPTFTGLLLSGLTASQAVVTDGSKNLISLAYSAIGGTSNLVSRDSSGNMRGNNVGSVGTLTTSAAGTTVLTAASSKYQVLQGSTTQIYQLPDATTLFIGNVYEFINDSTGALTVNNNGTTLVATVSAGARAKIICTSIGTTNGSWTVQYKMPSNAVYGTAGLSITGTFIASGASQVPTLGVGSSLATSAILSLSSTSLGFLPPVMTTTQKNAISSPAIGLVVYDLTLNSLQSYNGSSWIGASVSGVSSIIATANQTTVSAATGAVTIGTVQNIGTTSVVKFGQFSVGASTAVAQCEIVTASDTTNGGTTAYDTKYFTVGTGGATGGSVYASYNQSTGVGFIGVLSPSVAWRTLSIQNVSASFGFTGIGTATPQSKVDVNGNISIGTYAGITAAPSNSVIISDTLGVGTPTNTTNCRIDALNSTNGVTNMIRVGAGASGTGNTTNVAALMMSVVGGGGAFENSFVDTSYDSSASTYQVRVSAFGSFAINTGANGTLGSGTAAMYISTSGGTNILRSLTLHRVTTAISYAVLGTESIIGVTSVAASPTITLPAVTPSSGYWLLIKDENGAASAINSITINPNGNNINNSPSNVVITTAGGSVILYSAGATGWFTYV